METFVTIRAGEIINRRTLAALPDGRYKLTKAKKRSNQQNAYFHAVCVPPVFEGLRDAGFDTVRTHEDAKTVLKSLFLKKSISNDIETFEIIRDTHTLTTVEFMEFIADVQRWAVEYLGIIIPDPNTQMQFFNEEKVN